ncbi:HAMP domain-containing sensor histidine kinase [Clostridium sp. BJN0001]|uniref:sensor histidine kinase n=1 Tax=Clostridium sp. BJN0001 TaxID=2930219 RepID=UPI001FD3593F|nr:HAMP domain-containing sensor histidine kinase [Clostridium sp. BJN0001]
MKNKILIFVFTIILFCALIAGSFFILLTNLDEIENTKQQLKNYNYLIEQTNYLKDDEEFNGLSNLDIKINDVNVRITLIDISGEVLFDNQVNTLENHLSRLEVQDAIENGSAYSIRYSSTMKASYMYCATRIDDNLIIRTSVPIKMMKVFQKENVQYYILILAVILIFGLVISLRFIKRIVQPIKNLEEATLKMKNGNYKIRADVKTNDELGVLAESFNDMADELQLKIKEVVDKQEKLESILKSMVGGIIAVDNENNIISINPSAYRLLGIKKNVQNKNILSCLSDYDIKSFLEDDSKTTEEIKVLHPIERDLRVSKSELLSFDQKIGLVINFQDITDMKRVELMRSQFVANVSHELKTPLTSIKGFAETLRIVNDDKTRNKFLDIINNEAERLTRLINDILVLSNIESNLVCDVDEFLPDTVLDTVFDMVKDMAIKKNVKINYESDNSELILGDKDKFYQMTLNLIENAIKYSDPQKDEKTIDVKSYSKNRFYYFIVSDNGIGIPEEDISRIFERFYRVDKSRKKGGTGGTGLGLAIVKHIVKTFNGNLDVKSEITKGSTFTVIIPVN